MGTASDSPRTGADVIAALDAAAGHCEQWRGEFWMHAATLLRDMKTAAALELRRAAGDVQREPLLFEEKRVSHAVA